MTPSGAGALNGPHGLPDGPGGMAVADVDGRLLQVNDSLVRMTGRSAEGLLGAPLESLFTMAGQALYQSYLLPLLRLHGNVEEFALSLQTNAGGRCDVLVFAQSDLAVERAPIRLLVVPYRTRRAVDDELVRVREAADQAPGMLFEFVREADGRAHFPYTSHAVRRLYGCTPAELRLAAAPLLDRLKPADRQRFLGEDPIASQEATVQFAMRVATADGTVAWHEVNATVRRHAGGAVSWHGQVADVTPLRALEEQALQRQAAEQSRQAQMEFMGRVSHELRTPLNAILGFAQLMASSADEALTPGQQRQLGLISAAGEQLRLLVDDVLDIARLQDCQFGVKIARVDARAVLQRCLALAAPHAQRGGIVLQHVGSEDPAWVHADARRLAQVLGNLVSNAIKYNHPGGRVQAGVAAIDGQVSISIADTGRGMDEAQLRALFQPFNRLGAETSGIDGTGLGLVITRQLVEQMHGRVNVTSRPAEGSTFSVVLPGPRGDPAPRQAVAPPPLKVIEPAHWTEPSLDVAPSGTLLYVEDNAVNALVLEGIVARRPGIRFRVAGSGREAMSIALASPPDLLLIDHHLPDTDGLTLLGQLREHVPLRNVPAIMVSASANEQACENARRAGFAGFWTKPLDVAATLAGLDTVLGELAAAGRSCSSAPDPHAPRASVARGSSPRRGGGSRSVI